MSSLKALRSLRDGWNGPGSQAISNSAFDSFTALSHKLAGAVPEPIASNAAGIRLEWDVAEESFSAEINADHLYICHLATDPRNDWDKTLALDNMDELEQFLRSNFRR